MLTERAGRRSRAPCERHTPGSTSRRHRQAAKERRGVYLGLRLSVYLAIHSIILSSFCPSVCIHLLLSDKKKCNTHFLSLADKAFPLRSQPQEGGAGRRRRLNRAGAQPLFLLLYFFSDSGLSPCSLLFLSRQTLNAKLL